MIIENEFATVDVHVEGASLRILTRGLPELKGGNQVERCAYCKESLDNLRKLLMLVPPGHHGMYGCIITPPVNSKAGFAVHFLHYMQVLYWRGITMVIEIGRFNITEDNQKFIINSPAGEVVAYPKNRGSIVESLSFENVPSFVLKKDIAIELEGRTFTVKVACGNAF